LPQEWQGSRTLRVSSELVVLSAIVNIKPKHVPGRERAHPAPLDITRQ
jgi:hypothetical protein